jgi:ubiquinone/menaquinone biosynthesis C-methylase UbiE
MEKNRLSSCVVIPHLESREQLMAVAAVRNFWPDSKCAKAFWSQQEVRPYRQLLSDTLDWADPKAGESWLDLGCGSGPLSAGLWERTKGTVASVLGVDCAAVNDEAYERLRHSLKPSPGQRVRFECHNFSEGLGHYSKNQFDHAVSGLSITYAEHWDEQKEQWTTAAYDRVLADVCRVIRPGGRFVFSVNVPEPKWWKVGLLSLGDLFRAGQPLRFLKRAARMMKYGAWLKREARTGRFHYLPANEVTAKLAAAGFERIEHRLSYSKQAYVFRAYKPQR